MYIYKIICNISIKFINVITSTGLPTMDETFMTIHLKT